MQLTLSELKVPMAGAACMLAAGLLLGGAMQPHLDAADGRPAGPQMFADWPGVRSTGPFDSGTSFVNYQGKMPDYVLGTDWKKTMAPPQERAAVSAPREAVIDEPSSPPEPETYSRVAYEEPVAPPRRYVPHTYPSLGPARSASDAAVDDDSLPSDPDNGH
jgi:hypothetical protein